MMNQVFLMGRLTKDPEVKELESGKKVSTVTLAVQRSYKNAKGVYEADFVDCTLWDGIAENTANYCHKGDMVGIKGRIQTEKYEKDGVKKEKYSVVADKLTFLASAKNKSKEDLEV